MDEELLTEESVTPTKTYKVVNGRVSGFTDGLSAMVQTIEKTLQTERFEWPIYTDSYGVELSDLIGANMDLVKAEVERLITEAIEVDDRVLSIDNFEIINEKKDSLTVRFVVTTIYGSISLEQEVSV